MQKTKETQPEVAQPKENEKIGEDVLEHEERNLGMCEDHRKEKKKRQKMMEKQTCK